MIWQEFQRRAQRHASKVAFVEGARTYTYAELEQAALALGRRLPGAATQTSPRRVLVRESRPGAALLAALACWSRGHVPVMLRARTPEAVVASVRQRTQPAAEWLGEEEWDGVALDDPTDPRAVFSARDEALVICTSGTSGNPKLVALPAASVCLNATTIANALGLQADDRVAVATPLGYLYGLMGGCLAALWSGACCRMFDPGGPLTTLQAAITADGLTVVQGPPTLFRLFLGYANGTIFPGVRVVTTGGEDFSDVLLAGLGQTFPLARQLALYGMTEAGPRISHEEFARGGGRDGCVGKPYAHVECKLEAGAWSSAANTGRLAIRGPSVMLGYIGEDGRYEGLEDDGFFRSNDLVSFDEEGRLHFRGRIDRMFKCGGKLVNPLAVEEVLRRFPGVQEVVCKAAPHALLGLVLEAEILPAAGLSLDSDQLAAFARRECEPHAMPRVFRIVKTMEQAPSGKLLRPSASNSQHPTDQRDAGP